MARYLDVTDVFIYSIKIMDILYLR